MRASSTSSLRSKLENGEDWAKVVKVWYKIVDFLKDEDNLDEALEILAARVEISEEYEPFFQGTYILSLEEVLPIWKEAAVSDRLRLDRHCDQLIDQGVYEENLDTSKYLDPSLTSNTQSPFSNLRPFSPTQWLCRC